MLDDIGNHGATLVALTPERPGQHMKVIEKNGLRFDVLSDPGNEYAARLGLRFALPDYLREVYAGRGIDLPAFNGDESWTLPIPARLVVGKDGVVVSVEADPDYTHRPEPSATVEVLRRMS